MALEHAVEHQRRRGTSRPRGAGRSCPCRARSRRRRASRRAPAGRCSSTPRRAAAGGPPTCSTKGMPASASGPRTGRGRRGPASGRPARGGAPRPRRARARGCGRPRRRRRRRRRSRVAATPSSRGSPRRTRPSPGCARGPRRRRHRGRRVEHDARAEGGEHELLLEAQQVEGLGPLGGIESAERHIALGPGHQAVAERDLLRDASAEARPRGSRSPSLLPRSKRIRGRARAVAGLRARSGSRAAP